MKNLLSIKTTQLLSKEVQKTINGGGDSKKQCSNGILGNCNIPGHCCGFDENGNYGCVIAQQGARNCR